MFIYIFRSDLFKGQSRKIISTFPMNIDMLLDLVNSDNQYSSQGKWYLAEEM